MGFWGSAAARVRGLLRFDKENIAISLAKGATGSLSPTTGFDLLQSYGYDAMSDYLKLEQDLVSKYVDYESFDDYPETHSALNVYADDTTTEDSITGHSVWLDSKDRTIKEIGEDLLHKRLRVDDDAWPKARELCKYGQTYDEALVTDDGLVGLNALPPATVRRIEGRRGELYGFIQDFRGRFGQSPAEFQALLQQRSSGGDPSQPNQAAALEDWEVIHSRLRTKQRRSIYGQSTLEGVRWIMKRLMLLEDAAMVYKLERAPERYAYYVDVGDMPPKEAFAYLNKVRQNYKKTKYYNAQTGKMDMKYNPLSVSDDIFVPIRKGVQTSRVEVLSSPQYDSTDTLEFFRLKLFAGLIVPKTYLGFADSSGATQTLSSQDVRFAKASLRVQREMKHGYSKMMRIHLAALNINPSAVEYEIYMTVPSSVFEMAQIEVRNAKADLAGRMSQFVSIHWILSKIFGLSDEEVEYIIKERHDEQMQDAEVQAKAMGMQAQVTGDIQMQQQAAMGAAQGGPPGMQPKPSHEDIQPLSRIWQQRRAGFRFSPINEQELLRGNRDHEKKMEDNFHKLMSKDIELAHKLNELKEFVNEIRMTRPKTQWPSQ